MNSEPLFAAPDATLDERWLRRLARFVARVPGLEERAAWGGRGGFALGQGEFEGFRPYRSGEDVRQLDWNLFARLGRPFVRVQRAPAGSRWCVLLDTGPSMGLGRPGKLQFACELALALAASGAARGTRVELVTRTEDGKPLAAEFRGPEDLGRWVELLESLRAEPARPWSWEGMAPGRGSYERCFVLGDLTACEPARLASWMRPGRTVQVVQVLAPHELDPRSIGAEQAVLVDPRTSDEVDARLDAGALAGYATRLDARLDELAARARRAGCAFDVRSSAAHFEDLVPTWIGGWTCRQP